MQVILSQTAEYALRAMAWLAVASPGAPVRARDLSQATGIPSYYLSTILRRLVLAGILTSRKGQGGGFAVAKPLSHIRFLDILAAVGAGVPTGGRCAFGWGECDALHPCPLHDTWSEISNEFLRWATTTTLADVQANAGELERPS